MRTNKSLEAEDGFPFQGFLYEESFVLLDSQEAEDLQEEANDGFRNLLLVIPDFSVISLESGGRCRLLHVFFARGVHSLHLVLTEQIVFGVFQEYKLVGEESDCAEHDCVVFEELPDDWKRSRCRQPKEKFNKA